MDGDLKGFWLEGDSLAPPCQADDEVVEQIIKFSQPTKDSVLFDLGCGDGRICLKASQKTKCRSVGVEIEPDLCADFEANIARMGLNDLVTCVQGDLTTVDLSTASIVVIYLLPESVESIKSALIEAIIRGATLICNTWGPKGLQPVSRHLCGEFNTVTLLKYDVNSLCSAIDINT